MSQAHLLVCYVAPPDERDEGCIVSVRHSYVNLAFDLLGAISPWGRDVRGPSFGMS